LKEPKISNFSYSNIPKFYIRVVIFEQLFFFSIFIGQKQWREKKEERE